MTVVDLVVGLLLVVCCAAQTLDVWFFKSPVKAQEFSEENKYVRLEYSLLCEPLGGMFIQMTMDSASPALRAALYRDSSCQVKEYNINPSGKIFCDLAKPQTATGV